jgi:hypothetical protein
MEVKGEFAGVAYGEGAPFGEIDGQEDLGKGIHDRLSTTRIRRSGIGTPVGATFGYARGSPLEATSSRGVREIAAGCPPCRLGVGEIRLSTA